MLLNRPHVPRHINLNQRFVMPTYEYACTDCSHEFEAFQSITAKPIRKCPECGKRKVERLISGGAGLLFKGSGFYITDYRSDSYKEAAKKPKAKSQTAKNQIPKRNPIKKLQKPKQRKKRSIIQWVKLSASTWAPPTPVLQ